MNIKNFLELAIKEAKKALETENFFKDIEIFEKSYPDLKEKSANLLRQYYLKTNQSKKSKLY